MSRKKIEPAAISAFCESMAVMQQAGIPNDEALGLLYEDTEKNAFHRAVRTAQRRMAEGDTLAQALKNSGGFPNHLCEMVQVGEQSGRTEAVMRSLAYYYDAQAQLESKLWSAAVYPIALLLLMSLVLGVMVWQVLPVFTRVYTALAGSVAASSYAYVTGAYWIGGIALTVTATQCFLLLVTGAVSRTRGGARAVLHFLEWFGPTSQPFLQLAQARFTSVLAIFMASGMDTDTALAKAAYVRHRGLSKKLKKAQARMAQGSSLAQAFYDTKIYEPLYTRMLLAAARSGQQEVMLQRLAQSFEQEANNRLEQLIASVEPALSAFLTVCVGMSMLGVMLPLVGILSSIG
jgi:type IV pilus assembly protein PilC